MSQEAHYYEQTSIARPGTMIFCPILISCVDRLAEALEELRRKMNPVGIDRATGWSKILRDWFSACVKTSFAVFCT